MGRIPRRADRTLWDVKFSPSRPQPYFMVSW